MNGDLPNGHAGNRRAAVHVEDKDLEAAVHCNNYKFIAVWLERTQEEKDKGIYHQLCGSLLRRASYCHSVDVVKCIVPPGSCNGEVCGHPLATHPMCVNNN